MKGNTLDMAYPLMNLSLAGSTDWTHWMTKKGKGHNLGERCVEVSDRSDS